MLAGEKARQHVFRDPMKGSFSIQASVSAIHEADEGEGEPVESWTAPYIFGQDGGQAQKHAKSSRGKNRKGRNEGGRRSRGGGTPNVDSMARERNDSSDVAHAHPKPLRQGQGAHIEGGFATVGPGGRTESPEKLYQGRADEDEGRRPLNFGGAFIPPSKGGNFRRPVPSTFRAPSYDDQPVSAPSSGVGIMGNSQAYGGGFRPDCVTLSVDESTSVYPAVLSR